MYTDLLPWLQFIEIFLVLLGTVSIKVLTSLVMNIEDDVSNMSVRLSVFVLCVFVCVRGWCSM